MYAQHRFLDEYELALDRLNATDLDELSSMDVELAIFQLERCKAKVAAVESKLHRRFESDLRWATVGALKPQGYLATKLRVPSKSLNRQCSVARRMADLPVVEAALAAGEISPLHRDRILAIDNRRVHDALVVDQAMITDWARSKRWKDFEHALAEWLEEHDQDGPEPQDSEHNRGDWSRTFQGRWRIDADVDPVGGAIWAREADRLEKLEFESDWTEAKERLGRDPRKHELRRTDKQRRAAAMIAMARRSATGPETGRRGSILVSVFTGLDWFRRMGELDDGTVLRPGQLVPWLDDVAFETFVFDTGLRNITVSDQRNYKRALRRFVLGLHRECFHEFCDEPASRSQVDHRIPYSKGGPTSGANGQPGCAGHNRVKSNKDPTELEGGP